ncbi:MAG: hypothetical protein RMY28_011590 [Nostoc sp. ChiSLP01]|nr:hypothetical protein [Nostoc sp. CmiSLP01]MDZ8284040.1 hypothetical protein [Nostoc sp. ChiSLP01]
MKYPQTENYIKYFAYPFLWTHKSPNFEYLTRTILFRHDTFLLMGLFYLLDIMHQIVMQLSKAKYRWASAKQQIYCGRSLRE